MLQENITVKAKNEKGVEEAKNGMVELFSDADELIEALQSVDEAAVKKLVTDINRQIKTDAMNGLRATINRSTSGTKQLAAFAKKDPKAKAAIMELLAKLQSGEL